MASLPYESAQSGDRALIEIQRILSKFGCQSFGHMVDAERGATLVQFRWRNREISLEASWRGYAAAWSKAHPWSAYRGSDRAAYDRKALQIAQRAVCSVLRDWVKGQVTAIECGVLSFDEVFMPHMLLASGERVIDKVKASSFLAPPENHASGRLT